MFRRMLNQQSGLPRRNQMPMRTNGNFGGGFALNPSLRNLSTVMQPRFKGQGNIEKNPDIIAALEVPGGGTFKGAGGRITTVEPGYIAPPSSVKNVSQNITPQMKKQIDQELNIALNREQTGQQITNFNGENGERTFTPDDQQSTIDNAALQERLKGRYDAPGYSTTDKIAAIAGVLGDVFSAPGDRNKTASIMQTIESRRAGDMQRQQARLEDEQTESVVDGLIKAGQIKPEFRNLYISRPDLIGKLGERFVEEGGEMFKAQLRSLNVASDVELERMGLSREEFEENNKQFLMQFERKVTESKRNYELRLQELEDAAVARKENHQLNMDKFEELKRGNKLIEGIRAQELVLKQRAANAKNDKKDFNTSELDAKKFFNKGLAATETLDKIVEEGEYNPASRLQLGDDSKFKSQGRRRYETQRKLWIQAVLRDESGAVIGQDEIDGYARAYFPVRGDGEEVVEEKRLARIVALNGLADKTNGAVEPYAPTLNASTLNDTPSVTNIGGVNYSTQDQ